MKRTVRLLSMLAATLLILTACSTAEEAGEESTEDTATTVEASEPAAEPVESEPAAEPVESEPASGTASDQSIAALAAENPQLSQVTAALEAAGLTSVLEDAGPLTVFAPNDDAFSKLDQSDLTALLADPTALGDILQYHVVEGAVMSSDLSDGQTVTTLQGDDLTVSIDGDTVMVGDATVVQPDIQAANGVIHVIDTVLQP